MRLYICWGDFGGERHACSRALHAMRDAGHDPEVVKAYGAGVLPDVPFNLTPGRRRAKDLTGATMVPVLELDDGTAIGGSGDIVAWAQAHPA